MTNGLNRAAAAPTSVELNGKTYLMEPLTLRDFGTIENEYLKGKPNPLQMVAEAKGILPEEDYEKLLTQAYKDATAVNKAHPQEIAEWLDTREGVIFSCWLSLKKGYPELTKEDAENAINQLGEKEMERLANDRDIASGVDELGNSTGRNTAPEKTKQTSNSSNAGGKQTKKGARK